MTRYAMGITREACLPEGLVAKVADLGAGVAAEYKNTTPKAFYRRI
jgi:hypothetical protein